MPRKRIQGSGSGLGQAYAAVLAAQRGPVASRSGSRRGSTSQRARGTGLASADLQKALDEIAKKQGGGGFLDGIQGAAKGVFKGTLDALDTPRAAVLSIGKELGDLAEDGEFSFKDLVKQTRDNYSFGEFLNEEVAQTNEWNPAARFALGLAGDIAIDPLTYLAPGAKLAELGPKGVAEGLLRSATDEGLEQGIKHADEMAKFVGASEKGKAAARVAETRSAGSLSDEMRRAAGLVDDSGRVERGVYWNAPGTGRIGRRLKIDKAVDALTRGRYGLSEGERLAAKQVRLGGGKGLSAAHETLMRPVAWSANRLTRSAQFANGADAGFRAMFRSGDPELAVKGFHGLEASQAGRLQDRRFAQEFADRADQIIHDARRAHVDMEDLHYAATGDGPAIERLTEAGHGELVQAVRDFYDDAAITANQRIVEKGGQEIINLREDYAPRILTDEAREAMGIKQGAFPKKGKRASIEKARKYEAGETLFGKALVEPSQHPEGWSVERQMEQILADEGIDNGWFTNDASKVMPLYARMLGRRVGQETTAGMLVQRGMGEFAYGYTAAGQKVVDAQARAFRMTEAARRRARIAEGRLGDASEALAEGEAKAAAKEAALGAEHPNLGAIEEYAQHWDEMAQAEADGLSRFVTRAAENIEATSTERAVAHAEALAAASRRNKFATRIHDLETMRDDAWERATRLWDEAHARLNAGKTLGQLEQKIAAAEAEIRQVNDLIDELGVAAHPRTEAEVLQDIKDVGRLRQSLGGRLTQAKRTGADTSAIERDLQTAKAWAEALMYEKRTGKVIGEEGLDLLSAGKDEITRLRGDIAQARAEAEALGNDHLAMVYAALDERLPVPEGGFLQPGAAVPFDGVWYHGTPKGGDVTGGWKLTTGNLDNTLGMHLTTVNEEAARYAGHSSTGVTPDANGGIAQFDVALRPDEVKMYHVDDEAKALIDPNDEWVDEINKFGVTSNMLTKMDILDDALTTSLRQGVIDPEKIRDALAQSPHTGLRGMVTQEDADELLDVIDQMLDDVVDGNMTLREALQLQFEGTEVDAFAHRILDDGLDFVPEEAMPFHSLRTGNHLLNEIQFNLDHLTVNLAGRVQREKLLDEGIRGIFYDHGYGGQELIALDETALRERTHRFKTTDSVRDEMRQIITQKAEAAQRTAQSYDGPIVDAHLDYENAAIQATQNEKALRKVEADLANQQKALSARVRESLEREAEHRRKAAEARRVADEVQQQYVAEQLQIAGVDPTWDPKHITDDRIAVHNQRQIATLEADYQQALADVDAATRTVDKWDGKYTALMDKHAEQAIDTMLDRGLRMFGANTLLPEDMTEVLTAVTRLREPGWSKKVLGAFDYVQNLWKGYATMSPGFVSRNLLGGVFNNALAGIERSSYQHFLTASLGKEKGIWKEGYEAAVEAGILTGGQSVAEVAFKRGHVGALRRLNPLRPEFGPIALTRFGSHKAEEFLRGSLFMDVYAKTGGNVDAAISAVNKYHFDYDDLSAIERSVFRRVIPFYTWTRKNFPLQLEMLARNPKVYNRYTQAKHNMEALSSEEDTVPGYFGDNFAIRLPWTREGGNVYYMPDLPFTNMMEMTNPGQALANTSPFIKTPIELWAGKQMWQDIPFNDKHQPVSPAMAAIPGLMPALQAAGWATHNAQGDWVMKDRHLYAVTSFLPTLAQARRLMPAEEKYQQRALTSWLSFLGAGLRTNTAAEKANQGWGRYYDLKERLAYLEDLGFVGESQRLDAEAKYGPRDTTDQAAPLDAAARLLAGYEVADNEEKLAFAG